MARWLDELKEWGKAIGWGICVAVVLVVLGYSVTEGERIKGGWRNASLETINQKQLEALNRIDGRLAAQSCELEELAERVRQVKIHAETFIQLLKERANRHCECQAGAR